MTDKPFYKPKDGGAFMFWTGGKPTPSSEEILKSCEDFAKEFPPPPAEVTPFVFGIVPYDKLEMKVMSVILGHVDKPSTPPTTQDGWAALPYPRANTPEEVDAAYRSIVVYVDAILKAIELESKARHETKAT